MYESTVTAKGQTTPPTPESHFAAAVVRSIYFSKRERLR